MSIALGCFGIAEITKNLDNREDRSPFRGKIHLMPTWTEFKRIIPSALRGSAVGSALGILPGGGPVIAQFVAYAIDKKVSRYKHEFGKGAIEGVAGQAAADEAAARTSFIPLMSIGIPENAVMALMMAAFIIKGIQPGPNMIAGHPDLFWGLVASMWIGNCFLLLLNVPLVRYWLSVFQDPVQRALPGDSVLLLHRHIQREQQRRRRPHHGRVRPHRLSLPAPRARSRAAHARLHSRADAGGVLPPLALVEPWEFLDLHHAADQRHPASR